MPSLSTPSSGRNTPPSKPSEAVSFLRLDPLGSPDSSFSSSQTHDEDKGSDEGPMTDPDFSYDAQDGDIYSDDSDLEDNEMAIPAEELGKLGKGPKKIYGHQVVPKADREGFPTVYQTAGYTPTAESDGDVAYFLARQREIQEAYLQATLKKSASVDEGMVVDDQDEDDDEDEDYEDEVQVVQPQKPKRGHGHHLASKMRTLKLD